MAWNHMLENAVSDVPVELSVSFDHVALTSSEIIALRVGDVVPLSHAVTKPVTVSVDGVECYEAVTGRRGKRLACLIVGTHEERAQ
jgi:flagellar motor switch protein FliM